MKNEIRNHQSQQHRNTHKQILGLLVIVFHLFFVFGASASENETKLLGTEQNPIGSNSGADMTDGKGKAWEMAERLNKGIVVDVSTIDGCTGVKWVHDKAQYAAVKAAGFTSIRIYIVASHDPADYKTRIDDALEAGLPVVLSFWGRGEWVTNPGSHIEQYVADWVKFAGFYKNYPPELIFDLFNEPHGLLIKNGKPVGIQDEKTVMKYVNAVIPVLRGIDPDRILAVDGPGMNTCPEFEEYVTPEYLTYELADGTGFEEDENLIGMVHMYEPMHFTHWIMGLSSFPNWRNDVRNALSHPMRWSKKWNKPVLIGEWGPWAPPYRSSAEDFKTYLQYVVDVCKEFNINWMYYSFGYNNSWPFNIYDTEYG